MASRRSLRSFTRICGSLTFGTCTVEQTALLLSLCQCTGWSADRICLQMKEITGLENQFRAENVWAFHSDWSFSRGGGNTATKQDLLIMSKLMNDAGLHLERMGGPLFHTVQPTTVAYQSVWCPKNNDGEGLIEGFTPSTRHTSMLSFGDQKQNATTYATPTASETEIIERFGSTLASIIKHVLRLWAGRMWAKVENDSALRPIPSREHSDFILQCLETYQESYEAYFGTMEHVEQLPAGNDVNGKVYIKSTGHAAQVFLQHIMTDRLQVIGKMRKCQRVEIGFLKVEIESLEEDCRDCAICRDELGVETPEGTKEGPLRMVICCGQYIGEHCLKVWLGEANCFGRLNLSCPICRFVFPKMFVEMLFDHDKKKKTLADYQREVEELFNRSTPPRELGSRMVPPAALRPRALTAPTVEDAGTGPHASIANDEGLGDGDGSDEDQFMLEG